MSASTISGRIRRCFILALTAALFIGTTPPLSASAQTETTGGAVYVVQAGDSLGSIALRFGVSTNDLIIANGIADPNILSAGDRLRIPGLDWVSGELATEEVQFGDTLVSLARDHHVDPAILARLNHLTSPAELFAGASVILPDNGIPVSTGERVSIAPGQSLLELAAAYGLNPYAIAAENSTASPDLFLPGKVIRLPGGAGTGDASRGPGSLPGAIASIEIDPLPVVQGKAAVIRLDAPPDVTISGSLAGLPLSFFPSEGGFVAMQGIHSMLEPGLYPLVISGTLPNGAPFGFTQNIYARAENYVFDVPLTVPEETIDPTVTRPEDEQWKALTAPVTPEKLWEGEFLLPSNLFPGDWCVETLECFSSRFGNRRSYNGSDYNFYHTGLDVFGGVGVDILAPAAGEVVFAGFLTVRGGATVINHGWGVYSAYMHQSELLVEPGDRVEPGQIIGKVGGTGRVQGPHLHWEILVGGIPVDPLDWMVREYP